ncbi:unnamed protein product [Penicillium nalgiovense]|nr:unnamed protein product [Penicillium nalgiovense]
MVVRLASSSLALEGDVILKLFDRYFATTIREEREICPRTSDIEKEYHQFILDGGASKLFTELKANSELAEQEGDDWNDLQLEAYLHHVMLGLYETEVEVYNTLKDSQGNDIPRLFACVTVPHSTCEQTIPVSQYVDVPGTLLQYIVGVSLSDTAMHAPMECWQSICEDAIRIIHLIGDRGILNEDVKPRNCVLHKNMDNGFKVFMIDFALCHFRKEYQDGTDWMKWKAMEDEEARLDMSCKVTWRVDLSIIDCSIYTTK